MSEERPSIPNSYWVIRETWLTRKVRPSSSTVACLATLFLMLVSVAEWQGLFGADLWMPASREAVFVKGEYWRLWTTLFVHGDLGHLLANSFLFFILSYFLYGYFGWRIFPWAALLWGGITNLCVLPTYEPQVKLIGASGIVYWMGGTWLILYFFLSRQKNRTHRILRSLGVAILLFMPAEQFEPQVSYRTHFVGFILGLLAGGWHYWLHRRLFRSSEVRQLIVEEDDPGDELPPPEGFPSGEWPPRG